MSRLGRVVAFAGVACIIVACTTVTPQPPVLSYNRTDCAPAPDLMTAIAMTGERQRQALTRSTPISAESPCVQIDGVNRPYVIFALPADPLPSLVNVGGSLQASRILAVDVKTLDSNGVVVRAFERERYAYRGASYSVHFRPHDGEAFILVSVDPRLVGQRYDSIQIGTTTTSTATTAGPVSWTYGTDAAQSRVFSYEGAAVVSVYYQERDEVVEGAGR